MVPDNRGRRGRVAMTPTLRFNGDDVDLDAVRAAAALLHDAGVRFDTGVDVDEGVPEWHLDWSLDGATLTSPACGCAFVEDRLVELAGEVADE